VEKEERILGHGLDSERAELPSDSAELPRRALDHLVRCLRDAVGYSAANGVAGRSSVEHASESPGGRPDQLVDGHPTGTT
jgi:hypothetical protein